MQQFVGRRRELESLSSVLNAASYRIASVTGIGGVGKTTLVEQFAHVARQRGHAVGVVNARRLAVADDGHNLPTVVEVLLALEHTLKETGCDLRDLRNQLARYRQLHQQVLRKFAGDEDSTAVAAILQVGVTAIRAGASVFPVAAPLNAVLTPELATKVSKAIAQHRKTGDRRLLSQPIEELSIALIRALNGHFSGHGRGVVLIFDEFELVSVEVERWVRNVLAGAFGELDANVRTVISGRKQISQDWIGRGQAGAPSVALHVPLEPFTPDEVAQYLRMSKPGMDEAEAGRIAAGLDPTYRLPLALRLLVADTGYSLDATDGRLGQLADELVSRLLDEQYTTPAQRDVALAAAVARRFDRGLLAAMSAQGSATEAESHMNWLTQQHFINPHAPSYTYFDLVRDVFCSHLQNDDPQRLTELHRQLAEHYAAVLAGASRGQRMRSTAIELAYHRLWSAAEDLLTVALRQLFQYLPGAYEYANLWSRMLTQFLTERKDLEADERQALARLAEVLDQSWQRSVPPGHRTSDRVADPALNILFTSSFDNQLPEINPQNAELWLTYFESRLDVVTGDRSDLDRALARLTRVRDSAADLNAGRSDENLLTFRVATDIADIHTRRGNIERALEFSREAVAIAGDDAPVRQAFGLYQLSNNLKRQGEYGAALDHLSQAIALVRQHAGAAKDYYLGRFYLDQAVTLTYLSETRAAEASFESSRSYFADISPISHAELSHRLGWLKRVRGDLDGALRDHELAIRMYREIESELGIADGKTSHVSFPLAKAFHSQANVYADMGRYEEAGATYEQALQMFGRQGGTRHEAIVRKDRAFTQFARHDAVGAEEGLIRALTALGSQGSDSERPAVNSRTHIAEAWLSLALIRLLCFRLEEARSALDQAQELTSADNQPLNGRLEVMRAYVMALSGEAGAESRAAQAIAIARSADPVNEPIIASAMLVPALLARLRGDRRAEEAAVAESLRRAAAWNTYLPTVIGRLWTYLREVPFAVQAGLGEVEISHEPVEIIDVYDEAGETLGRAPISLAHETGLWHRAFHCWIVRQAPDGTKFLVFQRRGPYSRSFPNKFDMSAAGHYRAGEGVEGGIRECAEELGIAVAREQLVPIARRTINETHSNGVVNREFQDVYLLLRDRPVADYRPGFPEVSAVIEADLDGVIAVVDGTTTSTPYVGVETGEAGGLSAISGSLTRADLIAESHEYHKRVFPLIRDHLSGPGPAKEGAPEQLPDGSRWVAVG